MACYVHSSGHGGVVTRWFALLILLVFVSSFLVAQSSSAIPSSTTRQIQLPSSKSITVPARGWIGDVNNFPATIAISPDHRYAVTLNDGYGSQETNARQSI